MRNQIAERVSKFVLDRCEYLYPGDLEESLRVEIENEVRLIVAEEAGPLDVKPPTDDAAKLREALTPSADTKAAYMGEFCFRVIVTDDEGKERADRHFVPWTTIKEIMAAIRKRAGVSP